MTLTREGGRGEGMGREGEEVGGGRRERRERGDWKSGRYNYVLDQNYHCPHQKFS